MRDLEGHAEERRLPLAVAVEIAQNGNETRMVRKAFRQTERKSSILARRSALVEPLEVKDDEMGGQKEREYGDVRPQRRDPLGRVDRDDVGIETEEIGIEVGNEDRQLSLKTNSPMRPSRFSGSRPAPVLHPFLSEVGGDPSLKVLREKLMAFDLIAALLNSKARNLSRAPRRPETEGSGKEVRSFPGRRSPERRPGRRR